MIGESEQQKRLGIEYKKEPKKNRILHIDDRLDVCALVECALGEIEGIQLTQKMTYKDGLEAALSGGFELVISDGTLPGGHGTAILKAVSEKYPMIPTMFISSDADFVSAPLSYAQNHPYITVLMTKPFGVADFIEKVKSLLAQYSITS